MIQDIAQSTVGLNYSLDAGSDFDNQIIVSEWAGKHRYASRSVADRDFMPLASS